MLRSNEEFMEASARSGERVRGHGEHSQIALRIKRLMDIVGSLAFLIIFLPLFVIIAIGVKLSSKGPAIFSQERIGQHGRTFRFYKFRSMVQNSDEVFSAFLDSSNEARSQWEAYQKLDDDPRITWFGSLIRRTSLDELPQLWNVLKGDMSLVGPRPCMPTQRSLYGSHWAAYCGVRPGLTGLWQVSGRNSLSYQQRVLLDAEYVREWSLAADARILFRTFGVVLTGRGSR